MQQKSDIDRAKAALKEASMNDDARNESNSSMSSENYEELLNRGTCKLIIRGISVEESHVRKQDCIRIARNSDAEQCYFNGSPCD